MSLVACENPQLHLYFTNATIVTTCMVHVYDLGTICTIQQVGTDIKRF